MKNSFRNTEDNEFMSVGMDNSNAGYGARSMSTDQIISKLEQKNNNLKRQVSKIERVLSNMKVEQKPRYGITLPEIKPDTVKKQLQNAYKRIEIYQHQVEKRRNALTSEAQYVQEVNKIQKVYKEKVQIHERLKRQLLMIKHESKQLTKMLKNDVKKVEYEVLENKLTTDIKYMQEKVRDYEAKRLIHIGNLQKQRAMIKEMQSNFLKENSNEVLQHIKIKIFKPGNEQTNTLSPSRSIIDIENQAAKQQSRVSKLQSQAQEVQDRTPEAYASLVNDAKLLKKMQLDYENKINLIIKQRDEASQKNFKSRNRLLEVEFEIQTIEKNIAQLKKLIDPSIFKPKKIKSPEKKQLVKPKSLSISHSYKFVELGEITKIGKRFSDRAIIGNKVNSKIVAITLYQKQETGEFVGFQATYKLQDQKATAKKGNINTRLDLKKEPFKEETTRLQGEDYFKTIDLFMKKKKILGISIVSAKNKIIKSGDVTGQRQPLQMQESEYPMCLFGSMLTDGFECLGVEVFEQNAHDKEKC